MKKILGIVFLVFLLSTNAYSDNIKDFKIESISIGDSALDYFNETELENGELDWFNYSYKEFATSLVSGKGIYDWFKISYKSDDDNFTIEGLVGIVVKKKYDDAECNKEIDSAALNISGLFKNTSGKGDTTIILAFLYLFFITFTIAVAMIFLPKPPST